MSTRSCSSRRHPDPRRGRDRGARAARRSRSRAHAGELVAVMGPSGSGKSTLLTLAGGLDAADRRHASSVEGVDLASLGARGRARMRRTSIGYVFQDFNLIPALTAAENVALPRELDGDARRGRPARPPGRPGGGRDRRPRRPVPRRDVRRPAAARRDRPRDRGRAAADPGRRADRRARHRDRRGDPAAAARPLRRRRRRRPGHPRGAARRLGRPGGLPARRRRRRRVRRRPRRRAARVGPPGEPLARAAGGSPCGSPGATRCAPAGAACWCW